MVQPQPPSLHRRRRLRLLATQAAASLLCVALIAGRIVYTHSMAHAGMVWNLFLAWVPLLVALFIHSHDTVARRPRRLLLIAGAFVWLIFFPNAPYMITDIAYLQLPREVPVWYDLIMFLAFAWTGAFMGLVSLYLMQSVARRAAGVAAGWVFAVAVLGLSGFGVFLGRFPRWNSWDLVTNPLSLLSYVGEVLLHPLANVRVIGFSALFSLLLVAFYAMLVAFAGMRDAAHEP